MYVLYLINKQILVEKGMYIVEVEIFVRDLILLYLLLVYINEIKYMMKFEFKY